MNRPQKYVIISEIIEFIKNNCNENGSVFIRDENLDLGAYIVGMQVKNTNELLLEIDKDHNLHGVNNTRHIFNRIMYLIPRSLQTFICKITGY